jgi:hypothetical protein
VRSVHKDILNSREYGATEFCMVHAVWLCVHSMAQAHILAESMKELQRVLLDKTSQCGHRRGEDHSLPAWAGPYGLSLHR